MILVGLGLFIGGGFFATMCLMGAIGGGGAGMFAMAGVGFVAVLAGIGLLITAIVMGLRQNKKLGNAKDAVSVANSKVIARYVTNSAGETIFDLSFVDWGDPKTKLLVRLEAPGYGTHEYRCNLPVWESAPEMCKGTAIIQGDWLAGFKPTIGAGQGNPYDK